MEARTSQHALTTLLPLPCWLVARLQAQLAGLALQLPDVFLSGVANFERVNVTSFVIEFGPRANRNFQRVKYTVPLRGAV